MPVVIQDFEVVPQAPAPAAGKPAVGAPAERPPRESDVARALARRHERSARVRAT
jgi:hypothetical protein